MRFSRILVASLLTVALTVSSAQAQNGLGNLGLSYLYGYGGFNTGYSQTTYNQSMPYFSLHPPVYYGKRYTRPYGVSPFAAWPQLQAAQSYKPEPHVNRIMPKPMIIENPCPSCSLNVENQAPSTGRIATREIPVKPVVIDNPYFEEQVQYTAKAK